MYTVTASAKAQGPGGETLGRGIQGAEEHQPCGLNAVPQAHVFEYKMVAPFWKAVRPIGGKVSEPGLEAC